MRTSVAIFTVKTHNREDFLDISELLVKKARAEESCIEFRVYENFEDGNIVTFVENWETNDLKNNIENFEDYLNIINKLIDLSVGKPVLMSSYNGIFDL